MARYVYLLYNTLILSSDEQFRAAFCCATPAIEVYCKVLDMLVKNTDFIV